MRFFIILTIAIVVNAAAPARLLVLSKFSAQLSQFAALSLALDNERAQNRNTLTVGHGDSFGSSASTSKLLRERPGIIALNNLGMVVDAFGNNNFNPGLPTVLALLPSFNGVIVAANVLASIPKVKPYTVLQAGLDGARVAFVGVFSSTDAALIDPEVRAQLQLDGNEVSTLIAARNEVVQKEKPDYVVALLSLNIRETSGIDTYVAPFVALFDCICVSVNIDVAFVRKINSTLIVSSRELGRNYVRVDLDTRVGTLVTVPPNTGTSGALLQAALWDEQAQCKGSAPGAMIDQQFLGRSRARTTTQLRAVKVGENAIISLFLKTTMLAVNATIGVLNTGAIRDDLPSSFSPDLINNRSRPQSQGEPPFDTVVGDCVIISPFRNQVVWVDVSSAELFKIATWAMLSEPGPVLALGIQGAVVGLNIEAVFFPNITGKVLSVRWPDGKDVDPTLTTDSHRLATISFLTGGGDGFPIPLRPVSRIELRDDEVMCEAIKDTSKLIDARSLLPGTTRVWRVEKTCGSTLHEMEMHESRIELRRDNLMELAEHLGLNASSYCVEPTFSTANVDFFASRVTSLTTVATALSAPSPYAVVSRQPNLLSIAGQLVGPVANLTLRVPELRASAPRMDEDLSSNATMVVYSCNPVWASIQVYRAFTVPAVAISLKGGSFQVPKDQNVTLVRHSTGATLYCINFTVPLNTEVLMAASLMTPSKDQFSVVEQVFFGPVCGDVVDL